MTDREMLEFAAKATGMDDFTEWSDCITDHDSPHSCGPALHPRDCEEDSWNPLTDDGDAFRLAVKLHLEVCTPHWFSGLRAFCHSQDMRDGVMANSGYDILGSTDPYADTRRAIVCTAAAIGKSLPEVKNARLD